MKFNYSKLLGRMKECGFTQSMLSSKIGINEGTLSAKLNNRFYFTPYEIFMICEILSILQEEIGEYFFTVKVRV